MNQELHEMFAADQTKRNNHPSNDTPEYLQLRERDAGRRQRVNELLAKGRLTAPDDFFHAAMVLSLSLTANVIVCGTLIRQLLMTSEPPITFPLYKSS